MAAQTVKQLVDNFKKILEECPEVVYVGDRILRQKTMEVTLEEGLEIGNKLKIVLEKYRTVTGFGRGLAAPQIGESKSVFVTFVNDVHKIYINSKIIHTSEKSNLYRETCLSCGFVSVDVKRPESVTVEYLDENGVTKTEEADSFLARLLQHEYDHLNGIVNLDRAEPASIELMTSDPLKEELREIVI